MDDAIKYAAIDCKDYQMAIKAERQGDYIGEALLGQAQDHLHNCPNCQISCDVFRDHIAEWPLYSKTPEILEEACRVHFQNCQDCNDVIKQKGLEAKGIDWRNYPCVHIAYHVQHDCEAHETAWECSDTMLVQTGAGEYGLPIRDGGRAYVPISNCPWCGITLKR